MGESEEEQEQSQLEQIETSEKVVFVLNQNAQIQEKPKILNKQTPNKTLLKKDNKTEERTELENKPNNRKELRRKSVVNDDTNNEIDFIILDEKSQDSIVREENEPSPSKKIRVNIEPVDSESSQAVEKSSSPIKPAAIPQNTVTRNSVDGIVSSSETIDGHNEETYFALSLVGILKRLPPHKRAIAKCHILSYLTELEYGSSSLS